MKAIKFFAFLLMAGTTCGLLSSCDDDDDDIYNYATVTFEGDAFDALIDSPQYDGPILYSGENTSWTDTQTTLSGGTTGSIIDYGEWGVFKTWDNGVAISNYIESNVKDSCDYLHQLSVPVSNGTDNFGVIWEEATLTFASGTAHVINSIDICPTTYLLGVELYGNYAASALTDSDSYFTMTITANTGASIDIPLASGGTIQQTWKTYSLASLGSVTSITFTFSGSDTGDWGLNTPKYAAIDNIEVSML